MNASSIFLKSEYSLTFQLLYINCFRCYVIIAPKVIRPATLYGVTVSILDNSRIDYPFISVRTEIRKDKLAIAAVTQNIPVSSTETLFMQVSKVRIKDFLLSQNKEKRCKNVYAIYTSLIT